MSALLLLAAFAHAEWELQPYKCRPLEFEISVPQGWNSQQDRTGMVSSTRDAGFLVTREPFLHDPKQFAEAWSEQLQSAGISTEVKTTKARGYVAYTANWIAEKAKRQIEVWRLHVPDNEMLYNFSFSAADGIEMKELVDAILRSFKMKAKDIGEVKFAPEDVSLGPRVSMKVPVGYVKQPMGVRLGGGLSLGFLRHLPGYAKPHVAGVISVGGARGQGKKVLEARWSKLAADFARVVKKPRVKSARYGDLKGHALSATAVDKQGHLKRIHIFGGKLPGQLLVLTLVMDAREERLRSDYFKRVCEQIKIAK